MRGFEGVAAAAAAAAASRLLRDFTKKKNIITLVFSRLLFVSFARRLGIRAFLILAPEISGCERSVVESARDREKRDRRFDERRRASHRTLVTHVKTQHPGPKMSAFTMASVGTSAAVPVSPPSRAATSATFRGIVNPNRIFLSSREHDVTGSRGSTASAMSRLYRSAQSAPRPRPRTRAPRSDQPRSRGKSAAVPPIDRAASTRVEDLARDPPRGSSTRLRATAGNRRNRAEHT